MTKTSERKRLFDELDGILAGLGEGELRIMLRLARRLRRGQNTYGELRFPTGRDWRQERLQELDDALIYALFEEEERAALEEN